MENVDGVKIDLTAGIARFGGKRERYLKSLLKFAQGLPGQKLDYNTPEALQSIHAIKGVAGNLSIITLFDAAVDCESVMRKLPSEDVYTAFYDACAEVGRKIEAWLSQDREDSYLPEGSENEFMKLVSQLKAALLALDPMLCEEAVHSLKQKRWPQARSIERVYSLVSDYRYDEALEVLSDIGKLALNTGI